MKILLVTKKTNQEILEKKVKALNITDPSFLEALSRSHNEHFEGLKKLREILAAESIACTELKRGMSWPSSSDFDYIVTLGGDGTILSSSHEVTDKRTPILGIRSSDESIGYLCALHHKNLKDLPTKLKNIDSESMMVERLSAEVTFQKNGSKVVTPPVLNDFLFANENPSSTTRYAISLNDHEELHKSSGIWIATPSGSTAAISTIGAVPQSIKDKDFQFKVRELYPKSSQFKLGGSLFNPDTDKFTITNFNDKAILAIDGQHGCINLSIGDKISFKRAKPLQLFCPTSFYNSHV